LKKVPPRTLSQKLSILKKVKTHGMSFQIHTSPVCGSLHAMAKNFRFESFKGRFFILFVDVSIYKFCIPPPPSVVPLPLGKGGREYNVFPCA